MILTHIGTGLRLIHDAAKPWDRRSPERLGINAQVDDLFHGRSDTGGPRAHAYRRHWYGVTFGPSWFLRVNRYRSGSR